MNIKQLRGKLQRHLLRPFLYAAFTRFVLALATGLLADFFLGPAAHRDLRSGAFLLLSLLFALMAIIAWLRLDGFSLPKVMMLRIHPRKKPSRMYGDMADYLDEEPPASFEDLEDEEKDLCLLGADALCCLLFLIASMIV